MFRFSLSILLKKLGLQNSICGNTMYVDVCMCQRARVHTHIQYAHCCFNAYAYTNTCTEIHICILTRDYIYIYMLCILFNFDWLFTYFPDFNQSIIHHRQSKFNHSQ